MSNNFSDYSAYYDLLYRDKDYLAEVRYLLTLIEESATQPTHSLLELGCGTGIHASLMAEQGLTVVGVDLSADMLGRAHARAARLGIDTERLSFIQGDAVSFRASRYFDVVASLFHVISYQISEKDLQMTIKTASVHLNAGGLFVFDFWYGPAVLWQRPAIRTKRLANEKIDILRIAEPLIYDQTNMVDVNYTIFVKELKCGKTHEINELHRMRYLFLPEIDQLLEANGFDRIVTEEWLTRKKPTFDSWGVCVVARKRNDHTPQ